MTSRPALQPAVAPAKIRIFGGDGLVHRMKDVYRRVAERAYQLYERRGRKDGRDLEDWVCAEHQLLLPMPIELTEYDDKLIVQAEVPGFNEREIDISAEPRRLFISGKRERITEDATGKTVYTELHPNEVFRSVDLPAEVNPDKVEPRLTGGILAITLPKVKKGEPAAV